MARGKGSNGNPDWDVHKDYGQPKWEENGFTHDSTDTSGERTQRALRGYYEREQQELRVAFDVEEVLKYFDAWVCQQTNKWWHDVWFQSMRREIETDHRPAEGISMMAEIYAPGFYVVRKGKHKGEMRPNSAKWLDSFRHYEDALWEKVAQFIEARLGRKLTRATEQEGAAD